MKKIVIILISVLFFFKLCASSSSSKTSVETLQEYVSTFNSKIGYLLNCLNSQTASSGVSVASQSNLGGSDFVDLQIKTALFELSTANMGMLDEIDKYYQSSQSAVFTNLKMMILIIGGKIGKAQSAILQSADKDRYTNTLDFISQAISLKQQLFQTMVNLKPGGETIKFTSTPPKSASSASTNQGLPGMSNAATSSSVQSLPGMSSTVNVNQVSGSLPGLSLPPSSSSLSPDSLPGGMMNFGID
ncbi:hypothetical protein HN446_03705 [bacterium]|nr:hypothetical protein [bacterium]